MRTDVNRPVRWWMIRFGENQELRNGSVMSGKRMVVVILFILPDYLYCLMVNDDEETMTHRQCRLSIDTDKTRFPQAHDPLRYTKSTV